MTTSPSLFSSPSLETRHARRLYVIGFNPLLISENDLREYFSRLISTGLKLSVINKSFVLSVFIEKNKGFALVEFLSIELTEACLTHFDGVKYNCPNRFSEDSSIFVIKLERAHEYRPKSLPSHLKNLQRILFDMSNIPTILSINGFNLRTQEPQQPLFNHPKRSLRKMAADHKFHYEFNLNPQFEDQKFQGNTYERVIRRIPPTMMNATQSKIYRAFPDERPQILNEIDYLKSTLSHGTYFPSDNNDQSMKNLHDSSKYFSNDQIQLQGPPSNVMRDLLYEPTTSFGDYHQNKLALSTSMPTSEDSSRLCSSHQELHPSIQFETYRDDSWKERDNFLRSQQELPSICQYREEVASQRTSTLPLPNTFDSMAVPPPPAAISTNHSKQQHYPLPMHHTSNQNSVMQRLHTLSIPRYSGDQHCQWPVDTHQKDALDIKKLDTYQFPPNMSKDETVHPNLRFDWLDDGQAIVTAPRPLPLYLNFGDAFHSHPQSTTSPSSSITTQPTKYQPHVEQSPFEHPFKLNSFSSKDNMSSTHHSKYSTTSEEDFPLHNRTTKIEDSSNSHYFTSQQYPPSPQTLINQDFNLLQINNFNQLRGG